MLLKTIYLVIIATFGFSRAEECSDDEKSMPTGQIGGMDYKTSAILEIAPLMLKMPKISNLNGKLPFTGMSSPHQPSMRVLSISSMKQVMCTH